MISTTVLASLSVLLFLCCVGFYVRMARYRDQVLHLNEAAQQRTQIEDSFRSIALQSLDGNTNRFMEMAKNYLSQESKEVQNELGKKHLEIQNTIDPLKEALQRYQTHLAELERHQGKSFSQIELELKKVSEQSISLSQETKGLKDALKRPHVRGRWGEMQLKNCIDLAGMSEFADVTFQNSTTDSDGARWIPDMTVKMPGGRLVIVDAKTPIDAFLSYLDAPTAEARQTEILRHGKHVKEHVRKLAEKNYAKSLKDSADFTVMFLPNESFLYAALEVEPDLVEFALQKKVLIATPPTLIGLLKVIRFGWNEERLAESALKISETGSELHKRVCDFLDAYADVGIHLEKAQTQYQVGLTRLQSRVIPQAKRLEALGAKSSKNLAIDQSDSGSEVDVSTLDSSVSSSSDPLYLSSTD